jgi:hemoglobin-like flavoprotein
MTPEQIRIVRDTWQRVAPQAEGAAQLFYARLFEIDPGTRPLFARSDPAAQRRKLVNALTAAVNGLDRLDALVPVLEDLGRRHAGYGVRDRHYLSVGKALLWTLQQGLGPAWNADTEAAWREVYGLVSQVMRNAAAIGEARDATLVA